MAEGSIKGRCAIARLTKEIMMEMAEVGGVLE
jgi:hypothetical protein